LTSAEVRLAPAGPCPATRRLGGETTKQMVPPTRQAHLDDVKGDVVGLCKLFQLRLIFKSPALCWKRPTKGEQHIDELGLLTDRTVRVCRLAQIGSDPHQLGLGITDVEARCLAPPDTSHRGVASKAVLNLTEPRWGELIHLGFGSTAHELSR